MKGRKCLSALALAAMLTPGVGNAAIVTFESITGAWSNGLGNPATYSGSGTANSAVHWGGLLTPGSAQSGYTLATTPAFSVQAGPGGLFDLGSFTHENFPIVSGSGISGVRLTLTAMISVDGNAAVAKNFVYNFVHYETPNSVANDPNGVCANGGANSAGININGCADRITILSNELSDSFVVDGMAYTLGIAGFQIGGSLVSEFWTAEQMSNAATLKGDLVAIGPVGSTPVPEPFALAIFGTALIGLGGVVVSRRR